MTRRATRGGRVRLETPRLAIRRARPGDAGDLAAFNDRNRAFHAPWDPERTAPYFRPRGQRRLIRRVDRDAGVDLFVARLRMERSSGIVAVVGLSSIVFGPLCSGMLGYRVDERHEGHGLMRETLEAILDWAFVVRGLHRVEANIMPRNERSVRLVERLGFRREGRAQSFLRIAGTWEDHDRYAMTAEEWSAVDRSI